MLHNWLVAGKKENLFTQRYLKNQKVCWNHQLLKLLMPILYAEDYSLVVRLHLTTANLL